MPTNYKVLGQSNPAATTATTLYTVPSATQAVVSTIAVANTGGTSATFRIAIRVAGATLATSQYIAYDTAITANNSTMLTLGVSLGTTDVITVYSSNTNLVFSAFGTEIS
jgi:glucose-6-phosphate dehydrogenase assembly protein OpcA